MPAIIESNEFKRLANYQKVYSERSGSLFKEINIIKFLLSSWAVKRMNQCDNGDARKMLAILSVAREFDNFYEGSENVTIPKWFMNFHMVISTVQTLPDLLEETLAKMLHNELPKQLEYTPSPFGYSTLTRILRSLYSYILKANPQVDLTLEIHEEEKQALPKKNESLKNLSVFARPKIIKQNPIVKLGEFKALIEYSLKYTTLHVLNLEIHKITVLKAYLSFMILKKLKESSSYIRAQKILFVASCINAEYEKDDKRKNLLSMNSLNDCIINITQDIEQRFSDANLSQIKKLPEALAVVKTGVFSTSDLSLLLIDMYMVVLEAPADLELEVKEPAKVSIQLP